MKNEQSPDVHAADRETIARVEDGRYRRPMVGESCEEPREETEENGRVRRTRKGYLISRHPHEMCHNSSVGIQRAILIEFD